MGAKAELIGAPIQRAPLLRQRCSLKSTSAMEAAVAHAHNEVCVGSQLPSAGSGRTYMQIAPMAAQQVT